MFESEWYELKATGRLEAASNTVMPDVYLHNGVRNRARTLGKQGHPPVASSGMSCAFLYNTYLPCSITQPWLQKQLGHQCAVGALGQLPALSQLQLQSSGFHVVP